MPRALVSTADGLKLRDQDGFHPYEPDTLFSTGWGIAVAFDALTSHRAELAQQLAAVRPPRSRGRSEARPAARRAARRSSSSRSGSDPGGDDPPEPPEPPHGGRLDLEAEAAELGIDLTAPTHPLPWPNPLGLFTTGWFLL